MPKTLETVNIKRDMPTVEDALADLVARLDEHAKKGTAVVKVIHGYGSTGKGGKIRHAIVPTLRRLQTQGVIRCFIPGTEWDKSHKAARELLRGHPSLENDPDLGKGNKGCTIVALTARKRGSTKEARADVRAPADLDGLIKSDPERVYDLYTGSHLIRRFKPEP